jgi:phage terminase large subunit-like protein
VAKLARNPTPETRADRVVAFIERLTVPEGALQGQPVHLEKFEIDWIRDVYRENRGRRSVRRAILSIARKNGKSTLMACLALVHLVGPEAVTNGQIMSAANDKDQAAVVFNLAAKMVRADAELMSMVNIIDSTKRMVCWHNGSIYRAISADAGTKHGMSPTVYIYDELAQAKNRELFDALDTAQGAHAEPLGIIISTQSNDPQHPLSEMIDDGLSGLDDTIVCHLYAVPDDCEDIYDEKVWKLANPGLGTIRSIDDLRAMARRAQRMPSFENTFRNLGLNQRVTRMTTLISKTDWKACGGEVVFEDGEEVILSLDLATTTDLACLGMMAVNGKARFWPWFWKPGDMLHEHAKRDGFRYDLHAEKGLLELSDGRVINTGDIAKKIQWCMQRYTVVGLVYDPYRIEYLKKELDALGIEVHEEADLGGLRLFPWRQGFISMAPALDALETLVLNYELVHPKHPILTWNIANAAVVTDPAGNRKFDKAKSRLRIDGAQTLAMAAGKRAHLIKAPGGTSFWETAA